MLINQRRGKGSPAFRTPGHRFLCNVEYPPLPSEAMRAQVIGFALDPAHSTPLMLLRAEDGREIYLIAPEGIAINDEVELGVNAAAKIGSVSSLGALPDGTPIFNLELKPRDGGKALRATGSGGTLISHDEETGRVTIKMSTSSKRVLVLSPECRATVGVAAGGGRLDKPFKKAGSKRKMMEARNKYYPIVRGTAMNANEHPHGGKSFGKSSTRARGTPPGKKVGHIAARQTGRKKRRERAVGEQ